MKKIFLFSAAVLMSVGMSAQLRYNAVFTENDYKNSNTVVANVGDNNAWDNGIRLGLASAALKWEEKYVIIALAPGIPSALTFSYKGTTGSTYELADPHNIFYAGATKDNLVELKNRRARSVDADTVQLDANVRYIKIEYKGNFAATYNIKVLPATTYGVYNTQYCEGDSVLFMDKYYKAGTYQVKTTNYFGGDSIITLNVIENPTYDTTVVDTMKYGETKPYFPGKEYTAVTVGEVYIDTIVLKTVAGCDSTLYFKMVINKADQTITWNAALAASTIEMEVGDKFQDIASSTSELALTYDTDQTGIVEITGNTLTASAVGTVIVTPSQAGNEFYEAAQGAAKTFVVSSPSTSLMNINAEMGVKKALVNGQLIIMQAGKLYNAQGVEMR